MLGAGNQESALAALEAYPGGMQVAGQSLRCTRRCVSASWERSSGTVHRENRFRSAAVRRERILSQCSRAL